MTGYNRRMLGLALMCLLMLNGCGSGPKDETVPSPSVAAPPAESPAREPAAAQPDQPTKSGESPSLPEPHPKAPEPPATAKQDYRMNGVYSIVPKEGEAVPKEIVLLTFDDGPKEAELLNRMLDTLDKHDAKAIFFVNGYRVKAQPELLKRIVERGHEIGNHAWDHLDLSKLPPDQVDAQIGDVQSIVKEWTGVKPRFFRPPFGASNEYVRKKAEAEGMLFMTWSNGSRDWESGYNRPDKVIESVLSQLAPGSNILMHELPWTADALDELLNRLKDKGYTPVNPRRISTDAP